MLLFPQYNNYPYKIKFSSIPSGSKSINAIQPVAPFLSTRVISFLTNQLVVFLRCQPLVVFSSFSVL